MAIGSWSPFRRNKDDNGANVPARRSSNGSGLTRFQDEMNRMFEDFMSSSPWSMTPSQFFGDYAPTRFVPRMDISDSGEALQISAELPGMEADDVEINLRGDHLQIRGEKRQEETEEDEDRGYYRTERTFGTFERTIPLPEEVDADKAEARFNNGVLDISIPKREGEVSSKKVEIKSE